MKKLLIVPLLLLSLVSAVVLTTHKAKAVPAGACILSASYLGGCVGATRTFWGPGGLLTNISYQQNYSIPLSDIQDTCPITADTNHGQLTVTIPCAKVGANPVSVGSYGITCDVGTQPGAIDVQMPPYSSYAVFQFGAYCTNTYCTPCVKCIFSTNTCGQ